MAQINKAEGVSTQAIGVYDRLGLIGLINEGMRLGSSESPILSELFEDLWELVATTASGSKIDRLKPENPRNGFKVFEINAETGENLGRLNMLYLRKPLPCYYLVYVEVAIPFRKKGLGNRILKYFRDFLDAKTALGILDNIIPQADPTYDIYFKQAWEPVEAIIGDGSLDPSDNYMIYVPPKLRNRDLREPVLRVVHHIKRRRTAIDMRDNEVMVQRTITEFKNLYGALLTYFEGEMGKDKKDPIMRFMFTRFVTKLIAFRRRIADLLGYTGGESLEQIVLAEEVANLEIQTYTPSDFGGNAAWEAGDKGLMEILPTQFTQHPARFIQGLPNYGRPSLLSWLKDRGKGISDPLSIGDLLDLGFDPTRLKEITAEGQRFICERMQLKQLPQLDKKRTLLEQMPTALTGVRARNALLQTNPPVVTIRDRGNVYVVRRKIDGIHWEEAVEQLQVDPQLRRLNATANVDRVIRETVRVATEMIAKKITLKDANPLDVFTCFVSWNLEANQPRLMVDPSGSYLESAWMA